VARRPCERRMMRGVTFTSFDTHSTERGMLGVLEIETLFGFRASRIFYILAKDEDSQRAMHAVSSAQVLMVLSGSCMLDVDNGFERLTQKLDGVVYLAPGTWRKLYDFEPNTIVVVAAEHSYVNTQYFPDAMPALLPPIVEENSK
jgi:WxcM-like, C-terminal